MVSFSELRACKSCGTVFSNRVGDVKISQCPHCQSTHFDVIEEDKELEQE